DEFDALVECHAGCWWFCIPARNSCAAADSPVRSAGTSSQNFTQGSLLSMPNCLTMAASCGASSEPMVVYMRAVGESYMNDSGVPQAEQKPRCARLELAKNAGLPRVQAKFSGLPPASAANTPPVARWHMRQWQT